MGIDMVEQVDDGVISSKTGLVSELKEVHIWSWSRMSLSRFLMWSLPPVYNDQKNGLVINSVQCSI